MLCGTDARFPNQVATGVCGTRSESRLLVDELLPLLGVPEVLLSDHGDNLLAHVMQDVCIFKYPQA